MKIAFFTESNFTGKIPRDFNNTRTEYAWYIALDAMHYGLYSIPVSIEEKFDIGIVILPKKGIGELMKYPLISNLKNVCKKIAYMQEGPQTYFQDYPLEQQLWYYDTIRQMDAIFCHNKSDIPYYKGLFQKEHVYEMSSLMIEDTLKPLLGVPKGVMIGGNFCSWYGGFDSYIVAKHFDEPISAPSMGRKIAREEELDINHLPYMNWSEWVNELQKYKYGVHLMRTHAAGTFALNCSYWGIPCIGYSGLDTQNILHPYTTVNLGDIDEAVKIARRLKEDIQFQIDCREKTQQRYKQFYSEEVYKKNMDIVLNRIITSK
jgi:hypothetical protein